EACVENLLNRLYLAADLRRHFEICAVPIKRLTFIVGMLWSGITFFHNFFDLDLGFRVSLLWEVLVLSPLNGVTDENAVWVRIARRWLVEFHYLVLGFGVLHQMTIKTPNKNHHLLMN